MSSVSLSLARASHTLLTTFAWVAGKAKRRARLRRACQRCCSSVRDAYLWRACRADASLDELEDNPLPLQKAVYEISR